MGRAGHGGTGASGHGNHDVLQVTRLAMRWGLVLMALIALVVLAAAPSRAQTTPAPDNLMSYRSFVGQEFEFELTATLSPHCTIWGTDIYTDDSCLRRAAIHAGALADGQTGIVRVRILGPGSSFSASTRNGVSSSSWGSWGGSYEFVSGTPIPDLSLSLSQDAATLTRGQAMAPVTATATGGDGTYGFSVDPALPAGLAIDAATGTISGTPTVAAPLTSYTVTVEDGTGATETASVQIAVEHPALGLDLSVAAASLTQGQAMTPIAATATGGDGTYGFSVDPALPAGLAIDAATGTISGTPTVAAPLTSYTVTVEDGTGAMATASLTLDVEEDDSRVIDAFTEATSAFIVNRMDRILSAEPRGYRFDNRRSPGLSELAARADGASTMLRFAGNHVTPDKSWHFWAEGEFASYRHAFQPGQQRSGRFGMLSAGTDYLLTPSMALGLMAQFDTSRESRQDLSNLSGQGWMVGPYLTGEITPSLFFTLRGAVGASRNSAEIDIYEDGSPVFGGDFHTRRTLLRGAVYGVHVLDSGVVLSPEIDLAWMREHQRDYTVTDGITNIAVPGVNTEVGRMTLATMIEKPYDDGRMIIFARPSVAWNFTQSGPARLDAVHGSLELGFRTGGAATWNATGALRFDGLGTKNRSSLSLRLALSRQF